MRSFCLLLVSSLALAAPKPPSADALGEAVATLIKEQNRKVMVDVVDGVTSWTDSAILERNTSFPKSVAALIKSPSPDRTLAAGKVAGLVDSFQKYRDGYVSANIERRGPDCFAVAGQTAALVNCVYVDYLQARYPKAVFFVHSAVEAVILIEKDRVHALLMPIKR